MSTYKVVLENVTEGVVNCRLLKDNALQDNWIGKDKTGLKKSAEAALRQALILEKAANPAGGTAFLVYEDNTAIPPIAPFIIPPDDPVITQYEVRQDVNVVESGNTTPETQLLDVIETAQTTQQDNTLTLALTYPPAEPPP